MFVRTLTLILTALTLVACAHHEAIRVDCDGPLREINKPPILPPKTSAHPKAKDARGDAETSHAQ